MMMPMNKVMCKSSNSLRMMSSSGSRISNLPKRLPINRLQKSAELLQEEEARAMRCIQFLDSSPEPFHVVSTVIDRLEKCGFKALDETMLWKKGKLIKKGGKYYFTRNGSTIIAFTVGGKFIPGNGFKVIGAHTDSPNLKLKPRSKKTGSGLIQLNVETYGGGLWHTWFDRDLSIAGRVILRSSIDNSKFEHRIVKIDRPVLRVPNLCIHLRTPEERDAFKVNKEDHLIPILCDEIEKSLTKKDDKNEENTEEIESDQWASEQQPELLELLAGELKCEVDDIIDFELSLYDTQKASITGMRKEFLCSSRIDNLASVFVAVEALETHSSEESLSEDEDIAMVAFFDHEEVGSESNPGAGSTIMRDAVERISNALIDTPEDNETFKAALAKSLILSVDMSHAVHPNYASKHEKSHSPKMNAGVVIKQNQNQRYATNGLTGFFVREMGRRSGIPLQEFAVRNDCPCGSTIGPIISANTGIRAVDLGMPQLSMHSIREMMGCQDLTFAARLFTTFFKSFREIDKSINIERT